MRGLCQPLLALSEEAGELTTPAADMALQGEAHQEAMAPSPVSSQPPMAALQPQREPSLAEALPAMSPLPTRATEPLPLVSESPFVGAAPVRAAPTERLATVRRALDMPPSYWAAAADIQGADEAPRGRSTLAAERANEACWKPGTKGSSPWKGSHAEGVRPEKEANFGDENVCAGSPNRH
jgi:hypothetical protein